MGNRKTVRKYRIDKTNSAHFSVLTILNPTMNDIPDSFFKTHSTILVDYF